MNRYGVHGADARVANAANQSLGGDRRGFDEQRHAEGPEVSHVVGPELVPHQW